MAPTYFFNMENSMFLFLKSFLSIDVFLQSTTPQRLQRTSQICEVMREYCSQDGQNNPEKDVVDDQQDKRETFH